MLALSRECLWTSYTPTSSVSEPEFLGVADMKWLRKIKCRFEWRIRAVGLWMCGRGWFTRHERSGRYIDGDVTYGFISNKGKEVRWGRAYHRMFFTGRVD